MFVGIESKDKFSFSFLRCFLGFGRYIVWLYTISSSHAIFDPIDCNKVFFFFIYMSSKIGLGTLLSLLV
ncbi:hypothetical protein Scep_004884 [Stephania cephalantha]|uniref:Uncharacterized protein n=1 Tax=Stephania cephalantha TaxID=152367 RepID=A0AAP0KVS7_9MAGN